MYQYQKTHFRKRNTQISHLYVFAYKINGNNTPQKQIFTQDEKLVKLRKDLILEEVKELVDAMKNHDMVETTDALADILYVVYGYTPPPIFTTVRRVYVTKYRTKKLHP